jgi:hypothetical protein
MTVYLKSKYMPGCEYHVEHAGFYADGSPVFDIVGREAGRMLRATVCMAPDYEPAPGNVFIRDWSENEGILRSMIDAGLISEPVRQVPAGFTHAHECKMLALKTMMRKTQ